MCCTVTKIFFSFLAYAINIFLAYVRSHSYFLSALSLSTAVFLRPIFQGKKKNGYIKRICAYASLRGKQNIIMILRHSKYFVWTYSSGDTLPSLGNSDAYHLISQRIRVTNSATSSSFSWPQHSSLITTLLLVCFKVLVCHQQQPPHNHLSPEYLHWVSQPIQPLRGNPAVVRPERE